RPFDAFKQHVPCLVHVINLAVQAMLGKGHLDSEAPKEAESMDVDDNDDSEGFVRTGIMDEEEEEEDEEEDTALTSAADAEAEKVENNISTKHAFQKLRKGIVKI
ncbi:hypothetical protein BGZ97_011428, partial [Linnemannia gamsii]